MTQEQHRLVAFLVYVATALIVYRLIGGTFPKPLIGGQATWGMRWRSLVAFVVGLLAGFGTFELTRRLIP
jgi:hypothetical protein